MTKPVIQSLTVSRSLRLDYVATVKNWLIRQERDLGRELGKLPWRVIELVDVSFLDAPVYIASSSIEGHLTES